MKENKVSCSSVLVLLGLITAFIIGVNIDDTDVKANDDKQNIIGKFENDYGYIPKYEVKIKWGD